MSGLNPVVPPAPSGSVPSPPRPAAAAAKIDDILASYLANLASSPLDVKRWINATLAQLLPSGGVANVSDAAAQEAVHQLHGRVQAHSQKVANEVEELISQTVVRLPRTSLELSRMVSDVEDLSRQLQSIHAVVQPAVEAGAGPHVEELHNLRQVQARLQHCSDVLVQAATVDSNMRAIERAVQQLRDHRAGGGTSSSDTTTRTGMAAVGRTIREVQRDLRLLQEADATYGDKYQKALDEYEKVIEQALEQECLSQLCRHDAASAGELFLALSLIGRADAVLTHYAERVAKPCIQTMEARLLSPTSTSEGVSAVLRSDVMATVRECLWNELGFLVSLADGLSELPQHHTLPPSQGGTVKDSDVAVAITGSPNSANASQRALLAIETIVQLLSEAFTRTMTPLLSTIQDIDEIIACHNAVVEQLKVTHNATADGSRVDAQSGDVSDSGRLEWERVSAQAFTHALSAFVTSFYDDAVLKNFSELTNARLRHFTPPGAASPFTETARFHGLTAALLDNVKSVLRFVPERSTEPCVVLWQATLLNVVGPLRPVPDVSAVTTEHLLEQLCLAVTVALPMVQQSRKEMELYLTSAELQQRYPTRANQIRDMMESRLWAPVEAAIEAGITESHTSIQQRLMQPVLDKTAHYAELPVWGCPPPVTGGVKGSATAASPTPPALATYSQSHTTPSQPARQLGEAIMEIPLTLESLRVGSGVSPAVRREHLETLLEEVSETWLDQMVRLAIEDFVAKARRVRVYPLPEEGPSSVLHIAGVWEQVTTDLRYLQNVLSAVSEEQFACLEEALDSMRRLPPPSLEDTKHSFVVGDKLDQTAVARGIHEGERGWYRPAR